MEIRKRWNTELIINEANKVHNNLYTYDRTVYKTMHHKIIITCRIHGDFEQEPNAHIRGQGCRKCSIEKIANLQRSNTIDFISKAKLLYGNTYDYSKVIYGNTAHDEVIIICKYHKEFRVTPNKHLSQLTGCPICGRLSGGWTKERYIAEANNKPIKLYLVRCYDTQEEFYKIGTTFTTIEHRLGYNSRLPYRYELLDFIESNNAGYIYDLERLLILRYEIYKYEPKLFFDGFTECFNIRINIRI